MGSRLRAEAYQSQYGTERCHYIGNEMGNANAESTDSKLTQYRDERRLNALCSSVEISSRDRTENEATL
jgi:hypothetical protein